MRNLLWPDSAATNADDIEQHFSGGSTALKECFLAIDEETPVGFIELNIRSYAEGSDRTEVPYVEGWFIDEAHRGRGLGKLLMDEAMAWARASGYSELASDAELGNETSIAIHRRLGFMETGRIVCFLKQLDQPAVPGAATHGDPD